MVVCQVDGDVLAPGMLADVGQGLLAGSKGCQFKLLVELDGTGRRAHLGLDRSAPLKAARQPLDGGDQALVKYRRSQVHHDALARTQCMLQHVLCGAHMRQRLRVRVVPGQPGKVELDGRQRATNIIVNLARDGGAFLFDGRLQVLGKAGQPLLRRRQLADCLFPRQAGAVHLDGSLHHVCELGQIVLEHVVAHPELYGRDGGRFANGARNQHEGWARALRRKRLPCLDGSESRQTVVGEDQVDATAARLLGELFECLDSLDVEVELGCLQGAFDQVMIDRRVFQVQDADPLGPLFLSRHRCFHQPP